ncbi:MAG: hypothetical protein ABR540_13825 [Acidimicrobiales bacterium]
MPDTSADLAAAVADLDDGYLKVMLLLAVRRARSEEPRRSGFWHALAVTLAEEQETRRSAAELRPDGEAPDPEEAEEVERVLDELVHDLTTLKAEMREVTGDISGAASDA